MIVTIVTKQNKKKMIFFTIKNHPLSFKIPTFIISVPNVLKKI